MSIESEKGNNINLEKPDRIPRHTHNGIDSVKLDVKNIRKHLLSSDPDAYFYDSTPFFVGQIEGYPGSAPQLYTKTISTGTGTETIVDPASITNVNAWLVSMNEVFALMRERQQTLTRVLVRNGFATYEQNPASDSYDPLFTYFDRI